MIASPPVAPQRQVSRTSERVPAGDQLASRLRLGFRILAIVLCALHAYANRHLINPDGIAYLDAATGDGSPNGYWSPLYPWLLELVFRVFSVTPYWECAFAHAVNVGLFLVSLVAFEWLLAEVLVVVRKARADLVWVVPLPEWAVVGVSYALFCFTARRLVTVSLVTPDMLVAAAVYASCALLLRMRRGTSPWLGVALGIVLGLGFLAKAVLFLMAFVFLALSAFCGPRRFAPARLALGAVVFAAIAAILVVPLSWARGKLTYGESGRLNYLWFVQHVPTPDRLAPSSLVVVLPSSQGTYSLWADPSLHYDDEMPRFDLRAQAQASAQVAVTIYELLTEKALAFTGVLAALVAYSFFARRERVREWLAEFARSLVPMAVLVLPAAAGVGVYLLVGHAEGRLVGPFLVIAGVGLLASIRISRPREAAAGPVAGALLACLAVLFAGNLLFDSGKALQSAHAGEGEAHPHALVAEALAREGLRPGDGVGSIGFTFNAYWARLARVRIVAEVPARRASHLWTGSPETQEAAWRAFRDAGAGFVVADSLPPSIVGWTRVPGTGFSYRRLGDENAY